MDASDVIIIGTDAGVGTLAAHRDGQRAPRRRPPAHAAGLTRGEW